MRVGLPWRRPSDRELLVGKGLFRGELKHWGKDYLPLGGGFYDDVYTTEIRVKPSAMAPRVAQAAVEALESRGMSPREIKIKDDYVKVMIRPADFERAKNENVQFGSMIHNREVLGKDLIGILTPKNYQLVDSIRSQLNLEGREAIERITARPLQRDDGEYIPLDDSERTKLAKAATEILAQLGNLQLNERAPNFRNVVVVPPMSKESDAVIHRRNVMRALRTDAMEALGPEAMKHESDKRVEKDIAASREHYTHSAHFKPGHEKKEVKPRRQIGGGVERSHVADQTPFSRRELRGGFGEGFDRYSL